MITFIGMERRTSGMTRGIQLVNFLKGNYQFLDINKVKNNMRLIKNKIIILIRIEPWDHLIKYCKRNGIKLGWNIADLPVQFHHNQNLCEEDLIWKRFKSDADFYLVDTGYCKEKLETDKKVFVVPHHHINFENHVNDFREKVLNVGFIGEYDQLSNREEIERFLKSKDVNLLLEKGKTRSDAVNLYKKLDIGIVFLDKSDKRFDMVIKCKPNVKINNFQSYGIPSVVVEYNSYIENGGDCYLKGNDFQELKDNLEKLIEDRELRMKLRNDGLKNAEKYRIDNIVLIYKEVINFFH